jgi:site-specific recombinase XerD
MKKPLWTIKHLSDEQVQKITSMPRLSVFQAHLEGFGQYLLAERNYSESTKMNYQSDLMLFLNYLADSGQDLEPGDLTVEIVRAYLAQTQHSCCETQGIKNRYVTGVFQNTDF